MSRAPVDIVIPTVGRSCLTELLGCLERQTRPIDGRVVVVHDGSGRLDVDNAKVEVVQGKGRGPAAARNAGWRACTAPWVAFVDDDVVLPSQWYEGLLADIEHAPPHVGGSQAQLEVPLPAGRRPTDWERNVAGLGEARWITADMAYRRDVLEAVNGFDERFKRAYREDADLALRVSSAGYELARGRRRSIHPVRDAGPWVSVRLQRGNAYDPLMTALHGPSWRRPAGAARGRRPLHALTTVCAAVAAAAGAAGRRTWAAAAAATWAALTAELAWARIAPGPRTTAEVAKMVATSIAIPFAATYWWLHGIFSAARAVR